MQYVYATHVPLHPLVRSPMPPGEGAKKIIAAWAKERVGIDIGDWSDGSDLLGTTTARWSTIAGDRGRLSRLAVTQPDPSGPWSWQTTIWIGRDDAGAWIRLRIGLEPRDEGVVIDPSVSVGAPRFLNSLADHYRMELDGHPVEQVWTVSPVEAARYVDFLESPTRHLPVVAVTRPSGGNPPVVPQSLARRLSGIAHVVAVEPPTTYDVSDLITPTRSVFGGAIRLYWPGFNRDSHPYRHPLFMYPGQRGGIEAFVDSLSVRLGQAAGSAFGPPALEIALRREAAVRVAAEARARREAQQAAAKEARGGLTAEEFEAFSKEFDELAEAKRIADDRMIELERELEEEREANVAQRKAWAALAQDHADETVVAAAEDRIPTTVREAVEIAASCCPDLFFTQSAYESASESLYSGPEQVLADLRVLQEVAHLWATDSMTGDFRAEFDSRPVTYRPGVSQTALSTYESDYAITYKGRKAMLGPHLRRGVGAPPTILRIYWYKDDESRKLVVGHVGRKLRDDSNRN
jgi:hypothetical protein